MEAKKRAKLIYNDFCYEFVRNQLKNPTEKAKIASIDYVNTHIQYLLLKKDAVKNISFAKKVLSELEKI